MLDEMTLERRLVTLEQKVSQIQQKIESKDTSENWLHKMIGSISDEAAFTEALEYGRIFRQADKPIDEAS
ncbi:transferase hexapeptide repeat containing protein [Merismopedia glauca]|uniref:Transferase hexapeptide repeat containing protein n=2 Tax=Merismopedia TaxID=53402 RepID=A0A2T1C7W2_9CYAN|nr:transferase hexapeptide repeat containing protein [Merismopedia glauca CCAP 1448/3]